MEICWEHGKSYFLGWLTLDTGIQKKGGRVDNPVVLRWIKLGLWFNKELLAPQCLPLLLWRGRGKWEQPFSWAYCCYDQFSYKEGLFDPPATGESFTCLLNWVINCIYKVLRSNPIYTCSTKASLKIRLANLIRTHAVLGLDTPPEATHRLVLQHYDPMQCTNVLWKVACQIWRTYASPFLSIRTQNAFPITAVNHAGAETLHTHCSPSAFAESSQ